MDGSAIQHKPPSEQIALLAMVKHHREGLSRSATTANVCGLVEDMFYKGELKQIWAKKDPPSKSAIYAGMKKLEKEGFVEFAGENGEGDNLFCPSDSSLKHWTPFLDNMLERVYRDAQISARQVHELITRKGWICEPAKPHRYGVSVHVSIVEKEERKADFEIEAIKVDKINQYIKGPELHYTVDSKWFQIIFEDKIVPIFLIMYETIDEQIFGRGYWTFISPLKQKLLEKKTCRGSMIPKNIDVQMPTTNFFDEKGLDIIRLVIITYNKLTSETGTYEYVRNWDVEGAIKYFQEIDKTKESKFSKEIGVLFILKNDWDNAAIQFSKSDSFELLRIAAEFFERASRFKEAYETLKRAFDNAKDITEKAWSLRREGEVLRRLPRLGDAKKILQDLTPLVKEEEKSVVLYELARLSEMEGAWTEALKLYHQSWVASSKFQDPGGIFSLAQKGAVLLEIGRVSEAEQLLTLAYGFFGERVKAGTGPKYRSDFEPRWLAVCCRYLAVINLIKGDLEQAEDLARQALSIDTQRVTRPTATALDKWILADIEIRRDNLEKAEQYVTEALEERGRLSAYEYESKLLLTRGIARLKRGKTEEALQDFGKAINYGHSRNNQKAAALAYCQMGNILRGSPSTEERGIEYIYMAFKLKRMLGFVNSVEIDEAYEEVKNRITSGIKRRVREALQRFKPLGEDQK